MSTEERGGRGGSGQGFASCQFGPPLKRLPPRMSRAENDQGGLDQPPPAVSPPVEAAGRSPPAVTGGSPPAPENEQEGLGPTAAAGSGFQVAAAARGSSLAGTPPLSSGSAEQEVQRRPTRTLASRCRNFGFDDRKLWVCAAAVLLVLPLLSGVIYFFFSL